MKQLRKTKIVGTIGPASENKLEELFEAGLNVCRINYSHGRQWYRKNDNYRQKGVKKIQDLSTGTEESCYDAVYQSGREKKERIDR